mgnify:FL=1
MALQKSSSSPQTLLHQNFPLLAESQPSDIQTERRITIEEFQEVINYACTLQKMEFEQEENKRKGLEALASVDTTQGIPLSVVQQVITDVMDVGKPYVEKALALHFPSLEEMKEDLKNRDAIPSRGLIDNAYENEIMRALQIKLPKREILCDRYNLCMNFCTVDKKIKDIKFLFFKKRKIFLAKRPLASISIDYYLRVGIDVYNPIFLRACGSTLQKLEHRFGKYIRLKDAVYHYDPQNPPYSIK